MRLFAEAEAVGVQPDGVGGTSLCVRALAPARTELVDEQYLTAFVRGGRNRGAWARLLDPASMGDSAAHGSPMRRRKYPLDGDQTHHSADVPPAITPNTGCARTRREP